MVATIIAQKVSPTAPGIIYTFFALIGFIGMMISTQIHNDDTTDTSAHTGTTANNTTDTAPFEQEGRLSEPNSKVVSQKEPAVNPIV
jgi:hypothetical protein